MRERMRWALGAYTGLSREAACSRGLAEWDSGIRVYSRLALLSLIVNVAWPNREMWLHIGCGDRPMGGMIGVDIRREARAARLIADCAPLCAIREGSVDGIYACMVLEHIDRDLLADTLGSWYRVLRHGGRLRVSVPDFESACEYYREKGEVDDLVGLLVGGEKHGHDIHHNLFDYRKLWLILRYAGFEKVGRYDWWKTPPHDECDDFSRAYLPHMDFAKGRLMALNMEAVK